jgi:hypothetical protein
MITRIHIASRLTLAAAVLLTLATTARAQTATPDPRWEPWIGCWQPEAPPEIDVATKLPFVCVTPTNVSSAVQIATVENGAVVSRDTLNANGQQHPVSKQGCSGWDRAEWSADSRRVYLRSELACTAGLKRSGTGLLAISPEGEWLDVQSVTTSGNTGVRATRYHEATTTASLPAEFAKLNAGRQLATNAARASAGAPLNGAAVVEAVKLVDTSVVQTWIVQRGRKFTIDAKALVALADAGVPGSVTDVLIGVSYPERFALRQAPALLAGGRELSPLDSARLVSEYVSNRCFSNFDPFWMRSYGIDPCASRYGYYGYGYNPYRYDPFGYGGYGYGSSYYYGGFITSAPIVVVKGEETHGQVVKGRGYTRTSSGSSSSGSSTSRSGGSGSSSSGSSGSSSGSSGSSSSGSSSSGRTAHPRPPA